VRRSLLLTAVFTALIVGAVAAPFAAAATQRFRDVGPANVHAEAIAWLADTGVTRGCGAGDGFCPAEPVTREQMASFLHRFATGGLLDAPSQVVAQRVVDAGGNLEPTGAIGPAPTVFRQHPGFRLAWIVDTLGPIDPRSCGVAVTPYGPRGTATVVNVHHVEVSGHLLDVRYDTFALEGGTVDRRHLVTVTCARA
jgi:hypothetical protein